MTLSSHEAELAQRLLASGLVRPDALEWLRAQRAQGDPRPLGRMVLEAGLLSPEALQRIESGSDPLRPGGGRGASSRVQRQGQLPTGPGTELQLGGSLAVRVERLLGRGGMGEVFLVHDPLLGRRAALKLVRGDRRTRVLRFQRETRITARLDHPGIPPVYQCGRTADGQDYLLMRYVDGRGLDRVLDDLYPWRGRPDHAAGASGASGASGAGGASGEEPRDLLAALVKVAEATAYAHAQGVVHRDLKPANVMLGAFGEVLLMDWGLARDLRESEESDQVLREALLRAGDGAGEGTDPASGKLTQDGAVLGTPGYLAPEQALGADVEPRADVFALGAILTEILCGLPPCAGPSALEALGQVAAGHILGPRALRPGVPPELDAIASRALAFDPAARYPTAQAFADDLRAWLEGRPVSVFRYGLVRRTARLVRRNPGPAAVLGTAAVLGVLAAILVTRAEVEGRMEVVRASQAAAADERAQAVARAREAADRAWDALGDVRGVSAPERLRRALAALQAAQAWRALVPADPEAAGAQERAALILGEEATRGAQWWLARHAFEQARGLGRDEGALEAGLRRLEEARTAGARAREQEVQDLLRRARVGELVGPAALRAAEDQLVRYPEPRTVTLMVEALEEVTRTLRDVRRQAYQALEDPTPDEARAGERPLPGLVLALDRRSEAGVRHPHRLGQADEALLERGDRRLIARLAREATQGGTQAASSAHQALALLQARALGPRRAVARLVIGALERLDPQTDPGEDAGASGGQTTSGSGGQDDTRSRALLDYLDAEEDEAALIEAALALAEVDPPAASEALLGLVLRFGGNSVLADRLARSLAARTHAGSGAPAASGPSSGGPSSSTPPSSGAGSAGTGPGPDGRSPLPAPGAGGSDATLSPAELMRRAQQLEFSGRPDQALLLADRALSLRPDWPDGLCLRASFHLAAQDPARARADAERAAKIDPRHPGARFMLASACMLEGAYSQALPLYDQALDLGATNAASLLNNRAWCREQLGDVQGALADLGRAIQLEPRNAGLWVSRGRMRCDHGLPQEGLADLERAIELDPDAHAPHYLRGMQLVRDGDAGAGLRELELALERAPGVPEYHRARSRTRALLGDLQGAVESATRAAELAPDDPDVCVWLSKVLVQAGRGAEARAPLDRAIAAHPDSIEALSTRCELLARRDERQAARADLERARALEAHSKEELLSRANAAFQLDELPWARADLEALLSRAPGDRDGLNNLGLVLRGQGDRAGAVSCYERLLDDHPQDTHAHRNLALILDELDRKTEALAHLDRAVQLAPESSPVRLARAGLRESVGDLTGAASDLEQVLRLTPGDPAAWHLRAQVRAREGRPALARADVRRGLELDPPPELRKQLEALLSTLASE